ncbi:mitochondrial import inner membrane translocase subunit tim54 [Microbotryomycetes sp. JL201]|nr:mitochondrial import inner membrane translocase subunit tim54 [Microbotryomycetes sp. JL201]
MADSGTPVSATTPSMSPQAASTPSSSVGTASAAAPAPKLGSTQPKAVNPFVYLGIPQAVFDWRPKMPGPKMSVFLAVTISLTSAYVYDRREVKRIQQEYIDRVTWMSEETLETNELARRVLVYGARVPDDGELERSSKWFKKYMKPILVASGTDYVLKNGTNPGGLGRTLMHEIRGRRIVRASEQATGSVAIANSPEENISAVLKERDRVEQEKDTDGGIVLLGRLALKEYLWALRKGYGSPIDLLEEARLEGMGLGANERRKDGRWEREEELMVRELEKEDAESGNGPFDEPALPEKQELDGDEPAAPASSSLAGSPYLGYTPYRSIIPSNLPSSEKPAATPVAQEAPLILPPEDVPPQPPLLLVPFTSPFGFRTWPSKIVGFFNKRADARLGGESALAIILAKTRPFEPPVERTETGEMRGLLDDNLVAEVRAGKRPELTCVDGQRTGSKDLDFMFEVDENPVSFRKAYRSMPKNWEYYRRQYYKDELAPKLKTARELASGAREPTKNETKYPPKTENELRQERLDKELRWRREQEGWAVVRSGSGVAWNEKWGFGAGSETPFKIVTLPTDADKAQLEEQKRQWREDQRAKEQRLDEYLASLPQPAADDE